MDIEYALIADHADIASGKLYLAGGGWDQTYSQVVPARVQMGIAVGVRVGWEETNTQIPVQVIIEDDDAQQLVRVDGGVQVGRPAGLPAGSAQLAQVAMNLPVALPAFGGYRVRITAGSAEKERVVTRPFRLVERPQGR